MNIDWTRFQNEVLERCTEVLEEEEELTYAIMVVAAEVATEAIRKYHEQLSELLKSAE